MVKKLLFIVIFISFAISVFPREKTLLVDYNDTILNEHDYQFFYLKFDNLNTNNFNDYLVDLKVIEIFPYINSLYDFDYSYRVMDSSLYIAFRNLKKEYFSLIDNYYDDKNQYLIRGIPIEKVLIYASSSDIHEYLNQHSDVHYGVNFSGSFSRLN